VTSAIGSHVNLVGPRVRRGSAPSDPELRPAGLWWQTLIEKILSVFRHSDPYYCFSKRILARRNLQGHGQPRLPMCGGPMADRPIWLDPGGDDRSKEGPRSKAARRRQATEGM
jgi:hypothetical protein